MLENICTVRTNDKLNLILIFFISTFSLIFIKNSRVLSSLKNNKSVPFNYDRKIEHKNHINKIQLKCMQIT